MQDIQHSYIAYRKWKEKYCFRHSSNNSRTVGDWYIRFDWTYLVLKNI